MYELCNECVYTHNFRTNALDWTITFFVFVTITILSIYIYHLKNYIITKKYIHKRTFNYMRL